MLLIITCAFIGIGSRSIGGDDGLIGVIGAIGHAVAYDAANVAAPAVMRTMIVATFAGEVMVMVAIAPPPGPFTVVVIRRVAPRRVTGRIVAVLVAFVIRVIAIVAAAIDIVVGIIVVIVIGRVGVSITKLIIRIIGEIVIDVRVRFAFSFIVELVVASVVRVSAAQPAIDHSAIISRARRQLINCKRAPLRPSNQTHEE